MTKTIKNTLIVLFSIIFAFIFIISLALIIKKINPFKLNIWFSTYSHSSNTSSTISSPVETIATPNEDTKEETTENKKEDCTCPSTTSKEETFNIFNLKGKVYKYDKIDIVVATVDSNYIELKITNNTNDCDIKVNVTQVNDYTLTIGDIHCDPVKGETRTIKIPLNSYDIIDHLNITFNINSNCPNHRFNTNVLIMMG